MKLLNPTSVFPAWRANKGLGIPRESGLEGQWGLTIALPEGKQRLQSWRAQTKFCRHQDKEEDQSPHSRLNQNYMLVLEGLLWRCGSAEAHLRDGGAGRSAYHRTRRTQGCVASGETTIREGVQPNPSADNWITALLNKTLPTRARPNFSH